MDILQESVLNTPGYYEYLHLFGRDLDDTLGTDKKKTSINTISAFALKDGTIDFNLNKIGNFTTEQFTGQRYDRLNLPPLTQTEQWHQRLAEEGLLEAKPQDTTATLNVIYVHINPVFQEVSKEALRNLFTAFGLDHSFLHSLCRFADNWHCIRRDDVKVSRDAGIANVTIAQISRSMGVALMLLEELEDGNVWRKWCRKFRPTDSERQYGVAAKWLAGGLPSCRQILKNETLQNRSWEDRVRALTPIIYANLTRADTSSMKTIAVMTMAFLPATAVAAIFAVPWERGSQMIQNIQEWMTWFRPQPQEITRKFIMNSIGGSAV
ncbi:hypothetical protein KVR01_008455 [Diaporthe batatas]|uniref:uncharacterized protein n=1 Tax=Diaporthe batatas TaxID=748121 RepID=UPI001D04AB69|nr:uncharacterized protein KVR01_008455 [Diaporthe batatas]KAG8161468.1 hypothetical protein KVR01_008455 [Diaporthe batatas]